MHGIDVCAGEGAPPPMDTAASSATQAGATGHQTEARPPGDVSWWRERPGGLQCKRMPGKGVTTRGASDLVMCVALASK